MNNKYFYNGKDYEFVLRKNSKIELEKLQNEKLAKIQEIDPEIVELVMKGFDDKELAKLSKEKQMELNMKALPAVSLIHDLSELDVYKVGFILLKCNLKYKDEMTNDFYEELICNMEEQKGFEETYGFLKEIRDNVFTIIENLNKVEEKKKQYKRKTKEIVS